MAKWLSQLVQVGLPINSFNQAATIAGGVADQHRDAAVVDAEQFGADIGDAGARAAERIAQFAGVRK